MSGVVRLTALSGYSRSPKWTIPDRKPLPSGSNNPGPGTYDPSLDGTSHGAPLVGFGTSDRVFKAGNEMPGPGQYDPNYRPNSPAFTMSTRPGDSPDNRVPGPGTYESTLSPNSPSYTLGSRSPNLNYNSNPGPGNYSPHLNSPSPRWGFGTSERVYTAGDGLPGPGTYNPPLISNPNSPLYTIASKRDIPVGNSVPGPGTYSANDGYGVPAYTMGSKGSPERVNGNPGPGTYDANNVVGSPKWAFGSAEREFKAGNDIPGPGYFNPNERSTQHHDPTYNFGKGPRDIKYGNSNPPPGAYDPNYGPEAPSYTMGVRSELPTYEKSPGPAAYLPSNAPVVKAAPKYKFGKSRKGFAADTNMANVGPGKYDSKVSVKSPKWSMQGKTKEVKKDINHSIDPTALT